MGLMSAEDCIFCRIATKKMDVPLMHEDDLSVAFNDINPQSPTHCLVIPKRHVATLADAEEGDERLLGHLMTVAKKIAAKEGLQKNGYRVVVNTGPNAGQTVFHLHVHLLGGRSFSWPPG